MLRLPGPPRFALVIFFTAFQEGFFGKGHRALARRLTEAWVDED